MGRARARLVHCRTSQVAEGSLLRGLSAFNLNIESGVSSMAQLLVFGGLIIFFLIVEPHGLARLWQITKEKLRLWPFPH